MIFEEKFRQSTKLELLVANHQGGWKVYVRFPGGICAPLTDEWDTQDRALEEFMSGLLHSQRRAQKNKKRSKTNGKSHGQREAGDLGPSQGSSLT